MPRLASAPVTWGVWEKTYGREGLIEPAAMLQAVRDLGFEGIELGPRGYFGSDPAAVAATLADAELSLVGAFVELHLYDEEQFRRDWAELEWTIPVLARTAEPGDGCVVLADAGSPERDAAVGRLDAIARLRPSARATTRALERVEEVGRACAEAGVRLAFHHHAGTHFETLEEVEALVAGTDPELVGFCVDSGHAHIGGIVPTELLDLCAGRVALVHLKDVDEAVLERLRAGELNLAQAWAEGMFCACPEGGAGTEAFLAHPVVHDLQGWVVFEQDRVGAGPADLEAIGAVEARHMDLVRGIFAEPAAR